MENTRYKLGVIDLYSIAKTETEIESTPVIVAKLCDNVDRARLAEALREAVSAFPLFGTTLEYRTGGYSLVAKNGELPIVDVPFAQRSKYFGRENGGYLYRLCVCDREIALEWSRILTDEYGARDFLVAVLSAYCGESINQPNENAIDTFLEKLTEREKKSSAPKASSGDKKQQESEKKDHSKIENLHVPTRKNPGGANLHILRAPLSEISAASGRDNASFESVIIPIFSNILYRRIKNREGMSITADVTIDCRNAVGFESMHNFTVSKILTYSGMLGKTDVKRVIELYDKMLDSAKDGVKDEAEHTINSLKPLVNLRPRILADIVSLVVSKAVKGQRSDFSYTNLGNLNLPDGVKKQLSSLEFYSIPESADAAISMLEFGDEAIIAITENYVDEMIISDFVGIAKILGINFIVQESKSFKQSRLKL